jgi:uncharacterized protein YkwD
MNWVDVFLVLVVLFCLWSGWHRGFILGFLDLVTGLGSIVLGYIFYPYTIKGLTKIFDSLGIWMLPVAFILTVIIARILISLITRRIARSTPESANQNSINRFFGIVPGAVNGIIFAIIFAALLLALPLKDSVTKQTRDSRIANKLSMQAEWINRKLSPVFDKAIRQTMNSLTVNPASHEKVALPFKKENARVRPDLETEMLGLVNEERVKHGLAPLKADPELTVVARAHSRDMFVRGYFAHENPDGKDPFDRMRSANVSFLNAGENLALAQTLSIAHNNLMNSPGHRANILQAGFGRVGIGILDGGLYGLMISQEFRN